MYGPRTLIHFSLSKITKPICWVAITSSLIPSHWREHVSFYWTSTHYHHRSHVICMTCFTLNESFQYSLWFSILFSFYIVFSLYAFLSICFPFNIVSFLYYFLSICFSSYIAIFLYCYLSILASPYIVSKDWFDSIILFHSNFINNYRLSVKKKQVALHNFWVCKKEN